MSTPDEVTVVIPVWDDYVSFLPDAVESVRRDSADARVVVVDNASRERLPELSSCDVVRAERRLSAGAARNLGLERVETEYVVFLDADDMLLEGTLDHLHTRIAADPTLSISATAILDGETGERHRVPRRFVARLARRPGLFAWADTVWSLLPLQGCAIMRTSQVRESGGYADASWGEDWVLAVSLAFRGRVELSERMGRFYRATRGSLWRRPRPSSELGASARRVRERIRTDPAVPGWARATLPLIATMQLAAVHLVRPMYLATRDNPARRRR